MNVLHRRERLLGVPELIDGTFADMQAWGLTGDARIHHMRRCTILGYRTLARMEARDRRLDRHTEWFWYAALAVTIIVGLGWGHG